MKFQELKINQEFRTSNGRPAIKVSQDSAKSLVPVCVSPSANQYEDDYVFKVKPEEPVYNTTYGVFYVATLEAKRFANMQDELIATFDNFDDAIMMANSETCLDEMHEGFVVRNL